jgi:hypothetical protein
MLAVVDGKTFDLSDPADAGAAADLVAELGWGNPWAEPEGAVSREGPVQFWRADAILNEDRHQGRRPLSQFLSGLGFMKEGAGVLRSPRGLVACLGCRTPWGTWRTDEYLREEVVTNYPGVFTPLELICALELRRLEAEAKEAERKAREAADLERDRARKAESRRRAKLLRPVRAACGLRGTPHPIVVVDGDAAPKLEGESWYHETPGGRRVDHPNAYRAKAKSARLVYVPSSHRIVVGRKWLEERGIFTP